MCNLCCVTSPEFTGLPIEDDFMMDCYTECYNSFLVTDDVALSPPSIS